MKALVYLSMRCHLSGVSLGNKFQTTPILLFLYLNPVLESNDNSMTNCSTLSQHVVENDNDVKKHKSNDNQQQQLEFQ